MCAGLDLDATGVDLADTALRAAESKARQRGAAVRFPRHDARRLPELGERARGGARRARDRARDRV
ncbi:hypothetical protein ACFZAM_12015 [Streptomyces sp. NPDC008079]|uniref:hypothetical protein n=1 Tax=Streptomyces sp. NPDC008079 TaxID=3364806 RepID=UPI0036E83703